MSKLQKVKIAVAINENGTWVAYGWTPQDRPYIIYQEMEMQDLALEELPQDSKSKELHWIEALVPIPIPKEEPVIITATLVKEKNE